MVAELAYCGINCKECPAYLATINNDDDLRASTREKWDTPEFPVAVEDINCEGCKSESGVHFKWCGQCTIRGCASERGVETCAHCDEYICDTLSEWLKMAGDDAKKKLDTIRAAL
ncbi:MAG: DUF3795 domain-containing protein [Candidatus Thorarchaeota archaeon]